jgi:hypothetical protein
VAVLLNNLPRIITASHKRHIYVIP